MRSSKELTNLFMKDLKTFNTSNFKAIANADLSKQDAAVHKAFSSVITRYFIFREKHPEVTDVEHRMLYFKLKLDMIANYFAEFPDTTPDNLIAFQLELRRYVKESKQNQHVQVEEDTQDGKDSSISDSGLVTDNRVPIEQQQESVSVAS